MFFIVQSLIGISLLELVNYVEHYGLHRERNENGRYERVRPEHSWNSNHPLGRALLFDLTRHADHHAYPARPYPVLRHHDDALQLPTGYPGMMVLALVPPLFINVMDGWIRKERSRLASEAMAA